MIHYNLLVEDISGLGHCFSEHIQTGTGWFPGEWAARCRGDGHMDQADGLSRCRPFHFRLCRHFDSEALSPGSQSRPEPAALISRV